jgi:hypothetical protein
MASKQLLIALNDFKASLVVYLNSCETTVGKQLEESVNDLVEKKDKELLAKYPIYASIKKKQEDPKYDPEYGPCPVYTLDEQVFLDSKIYQQFVNLGMKSPIGNEKFQKAFYNRLKKYIRGVPESEGGASKDEIKIFQEADMKIWPTGEAYFGKKKTGETGAIAVITYDSEYYSILEGYYGYDLAEQFIKPLRERLEALGYYSEPYDSGVWIIIK